MPVNTRLQIRKGTYSEWVVANPVLYYGEMAWESDTGRIKIGPTGDLTWQSIPYSFVTLEDPSNAGSLNSFSSESGISFNGVTGVYGHVTGIQIDSKLSPGTDIGLSSDVNGSIVISYTGDASLNFQDREQVETIQDIVGSGNHTSTGFIRQVSGINIVYDDNGSNGSGTLTFSLNELVGESGVVTSYDNDSWKIAANLTSGSGIEITDVAGSKRITATGLALESHNHDINDINGFSSVDVTDNSISGINNLIASGTGVFDVLEINGSNGFVFPNTDGNDDQILVTDGSGVVSWQDQPVNHPVIDNALGNTSNSGRDYVQNISFDQYGHVTGISLGTETVVDHSVTGVVFNSGNNDLVLHKIDGVSITGNLSGVLVSGTSYHSNISNAANDSINNNRNYVQSILLDEYGHTTGITTATETVVDTNILTSLSGDSVNTKLVYVDESGVSNDIDLSWAMDDTNLARLVTGVIDSAGTATFTRDDGTDFDVDFSVLFDDTNLSRITSGNFDTSNGILTLTRELDSTTVSVDFNGRYATTGELVSTSGHLQTQIDSLPDDNTFISSINYSTIERDLIVTRNDGVQLTGNLDIVIHSGDNVSLLTNDASYIDGSGYIQGTGINNFIPVFSGVDTITHSIIHQSGDRIGIGTTNPATAVHIVAPIGNEGTVLSRTLDDTSFAGHLIRDTDDRNVASFQYCNSGVSQTELRDHVLIGSRESGIPVKFYQGRDAGQLAFQQDNERIIFDTSGNTILTAASGQFVNISGNTVRLIDQYSQLEQRTTDPTKAAYHYFYSNDLLQGGLLAYGSGYSAGSIMNMPSGSLHLFSNYEALAISTFEVDKPIVFGTHASSSTGERMRIAGDGKVGIGTITPSYELDVVGNVQAQGTYARFRTQDLPVIGKLQSSNSDLAVLMGAESDHNLHFTTDNTTRMTISSGNGRVSIPDERNGAGSDADYWKFQVNDSTTSASGIFAVEAGTVGFGAYVRASGDGYPFLSLGTHGTNNWVMMNDPANNDMFSIRKGNISTNDDKFVIDSSGNVGIGTDPDVFLSGMPSHHPSFVLGDGNGHTSQTIYSASTSAGVIYFADGVDETSRSRGWISYDHNSGLDRMRFATSNVARMFIDSVGNVGIGTDSPDVKLHVSGGVIDTNLSAARIVGDIDTNPSAYTTTLSLRGTGLGDSAALHLGGYSFASIKASNDTNGILTAGKLQFSTRTDASAPTVKMTLDKDGNLGINETDPVGQLHIKNLSGAGGLVIARAGFGSSTTFQAATDSTKVVLDAYNDGFMFRTAALSATPTSKMRITASGDVGIGTTTPAYKLDVQGTAYIQSGIISPTVAFRTADIPLSGPTIYDGFIAYQNSDCWGLGNSNNDGFVFEKTDGNQTNPDGGMFFNVRGSGGISSTAMSINGSKEIFIGQTGTYIPQGYSLNLKGSATLDSVNINGQYTFPTGDGLTGHSLVTDGAGNIIFSGVSAAGGDGSVNTIYSNGVQVGDDDIEILDFSSNFSVSENPNAKMNIDLADMIIVSGLTISGLDPTGYTFPASDGSNRQVLATDGSGIVYWSGISDIMSGFSDYEIVSSAKTDFNVNGGFTVGSLDVYYNGLKLLNGDDYVEVDGTGFRLSSSATFNDVIEWEGHRTAPEYVTLGNPGNNRLVTSDGSSTTINGESDLIFDGTALGLGTTSPSPSGGENALHIHSHIYPEIKLTNTDTNTTSSDGASILVDELKNLRIVNFEQSLTKLYNAKSNGSVLETLRLGPTQSLFNPAGDENLDFLVSGSGSSNLIFADSSTNRVGIGNNSPTTKLDVSGVITASGGDSTQWNISYSTLTGSSGNWNEAYELVGNKDNWNTAFFWVTGNSGNVVYTDQTYENPSWLTSVNANIISGEISQSNLPPYVDDVLEYTSTGNFPGSATTGIIYIAQDTNKIYRGSGSTYIEISSDTNNFVDGVSFNSVNGDLTLSRLGIASIAANLDGRYTTGNGTTNYLAKWTSSQNISSGIIYDDGTNIGIGTASPNYKLDVAGSGSFNSLNINDAFTFPTSDGTEGQSLVTDGAGTVVWSGIDTDTNNYVTGVAFDATTEVLTLNRLDLSDITTSSFSGVYLKELSQDSSPQLGGNLDLAGNDITGNGNIDINGDLNADGNNVDIGSTAYGLQVSSSAATLGNNRLQLLSSETVFNQAGTNYDFRVEGTGQSHLLFIDSSKDSVGIATEYPTSKLTIGSGYLDGGGICVDMEGVNKPSFTARRENGDPVFSILPYTSQVYMSVGVYYNGSQWVHSSDNSNSSIFTIDPPNGVLWYSSNSASNINSVADAVTLWDAQGRWNSDVIGSVTGPVSGTVCPGGAYCFPNVDGAYGQVLVTSGDGTVHWKNPTGGVGGGGTSNLIRQSYTPTTSTSSFTVTNGYAVGSINVYKNGVKLFEDHNGQTYDYSATNGTQFILTTAAASGDLIEVVALNANAAPTANTALASVGVTSTQSQFNTTETITSSNLAVFLNGVKLVDSIDYSVINTSRFDLLSPAASGDTVDYIVYGATVASSNLQKTGDTMTGNLTVGADLIVTGYKETHTDNGNTGTARTIDITDSTIQTYTLNGNCVFTMPTPDAGRSFTVLLKTGAGSFTGTFTGVKFPGNVAPTITASGNRLDTLTFISDGTNWYGNAVQDYHL